MLPGIYYRLQNHVSPVVQADQFVNRAFALARSRHWKASSLLLCGDYDAKSRLSDITRFMDRVEQRTGVVPVAYLENSQHLKLLLRGASPKAKAKLKRAPYWLALYSHESGARPDLSRSRKPCGTGSPVRRLAHVDTLAIRGRRLGRRTFQGEGLQSRPISLPCLLRESRPADRAKRLPRLTGGASGVLEEARTEVELILRSESH